MKRNFNLICYVVVASLFIFSSCNSSKGLAKVATSINNTLSANSRYIYLDDLENGIALDRVKKGSVSDFFEKMMSNRPRDPKNWKVAYVSTMEVYYGVLGKAQNGEIIFDPVLSVDKDMLSDAFPIYENTDGLNIKSKIFYTFLDKIIETEVKPACDKRFSADYPKYEIKLAKKGEGINVNMRMNVKCYERPMMDIFVKTLLDKNSLEPIDSKIDTLFYKPK